LCLNIKLYFEHVNSFRVDKSKPALACNVSKTVTSYIHNHEAPGNCHFYYL